MKSFVFITSHIHSGYSKLIECLNVHPQCIFSDSEKTYDGIKHIEAAWKKPHKYNKSGAIYGDSLILNQDFSCYSLIDFCKFVYLIRNPRFVINNLIIVNHMKPHLACDLYAFRLRRLFELASKTKGAVFLEYADLKAGLPLIEHYLGLRSPLEPIDFPEVSFMDVCPYAVMKVAESTYERYHYKFSQLDLIKL